MPLYCDSLSILEHQEPTLHTINVLGSFLASAFVRAPQPALGPVAFSKFWWATYHHRKDMREMFPPDIQNCVKIINAVFSSSPSDNLSNGQGSQSPVRIVMCIPLCLHSSVFFQVHFDSSGFPGFPSAFHQDPRIRNRSCTTSVHTSFQHRLHAISPRSMVTGYP